MTDDIPERQPSFNDARDGIRQRDCRIAIGSQVQHVEIIAELSHDTEHDRVQQHAVAVGEEFTQWQWMTVKEVAPRYPL